MAFPTSYGISDSAVDVQKRVTAAVEALRETFSLGGVYRQALDELEEVRSETAEKDWNGYGARPISSESYLQATRFLAALPTWSPAPEVSVDPDGEVALDWFGIRKDVFSVSIGPTGELSYAGIFGVSRVSGEDYFTDEIPDAILEGLRRII